MLTVQQSGSSTRPGFDDDSRVSNDARPFAVVPTHFSLKKTARPPEGWAKWSRCSSLGRHGLFTDMPVAILPPEFVEKITQHLQPLGYEAVIPSQMHPKLRQWDIIKVLIYGWQRTGLLPSHPDINPGTVNCWFHLVAAGSDPSVPYVLDKAALATRRVERFMTVAQALGLLPKAEGIRVGNPQQWLHLFVPIHDWAIIVPPSRTQPLYWKWHRVVARRY